MDIRGSIVVTCIASVYLTLFAAAFWYLSAKPVAKRTLQGNLYPPILWGLRVGGRGPTESGCRVTGFVVVVVLIAVFLLTCVLGYLWWSGLASYAFLLCSWVGFANRKLLPDRFRLFSTITGIGFLPVAAAWGLAWAAYCRWLVFPPIIFNVLNLVSVTLFLWVAMVPITEEDKV